MGFIVLLSMTESRQSFSMEKLAEARQFLSGPGEIVPSLAGVQWTCHVGWSINKDGNRNDLIFPKIREYTCRNKCRRSWQADEVSDD